MPTVKEHRSASSINGKWLEPDPMTGPEEVCYDEMVRRTLERQTGKSLPRDVFEQNVRYRFSFQPDNKKAQAMEKAPGTVVIRYSRIK